MNEFVYKDIDSDNDLVHTLESGEGYMQGIIDEFRENQPNGTNEDLRDYIFIQLMNMELDDQFKQYQVGLLKSAIMKYLQLHNIIKK